MSRTQQSKFLLETDKSFIIFLCECAINVLNGKVAIDKAKLLKFEKELRMLVSRQTTGQEKRNTLSSARGLDLIKLLSTPCQTHLADYAASVS